MNAKGRGHDGTRVSVHSLIHVTLDADGKPVSHVDVYEVRCR